MAPRVISDGPFCWQSKAALRRIAESCGDRSDKALIFAVYTALTWEASNRQAEQFTVPKRTIAALAGVSYRKAAEILQLLERIDVIEITVNRLPGSKEQQPNTYTLGTACLTPLGTSCPSLGTDDVQGIFAETVEESEKNCRRKGEEDRTAPANAAIVPDGESLMVFPTSGKSGTWHLTADFLAELTEAHPGLDVTAECKLAVAKIRTGAVTRKTARGMPRFLWSWMARANDVRSSARHAAQSLPSNREYRPL